MKIAPFDLIDDIHLLAAANPKGLNEVAFSGDSASPDPEDYLPLAEMAEPDVFWYLSTPYSKHREGHEKAFEQACNAAAWLIRQGLNIYCPIAMTHPLAVYGRFPAACHDIWMRVDHPLMLSASGLVVCMMKGWWESKGIKIELETFRSLDKPIFYMRWPR